MASVIHNVLNIKNAVISIDGVEYSDAITEATVNRTSTDLKWIPVSGNVQTEVGALEETITINFGQDFTEGSLTQVLNESHGEKAVVIIKPKGGTTPTITANVTLKAPDTLGGAVGVAASTATFAVNGRTTIVYSPAPAA